MIGIRIVQKDIISFFFFWCVGTQIVYLAFHISLWKVCFHSVLKLSILLDLLALSSKGDGRIALKHIVNNGFEVVWVWPKTLLYIPEC